MSISLYPEWREAADQVVIQFKYGEIIPLDWLREQFQLSEPKTIDEFRDQQFAMLQNMDDLRQELLVEHRLMLKSIRGVGYLVVPPSDQVSVAWGDSFRRLRKEIRSLASNIRHIRHEELTDEKRKEHADASAKLSGVAQFLSRSENRLTKGD